MEQLTLATSEQKLILNEINKHSSFFSQFYFTGGTALSYWYLKHRYSDDLDFFSEKPFDMSELLSIIKQWSTKHSFEVTVDKYQTMNIFNFTFSNKQKLKVDFVHHFQKRVEKGTAWKSIAIDSLLDIAINKLLTINQRTTVKDFVDLFFLLKSYSLYDLMEGVKVKYGVKLDTLLIASDFLKVEDFTFLPRMIKPLKLSDLVSFFRDQATRLSRESVE
ncbi:MAG: nucleotidyl transferase AbiEii/AbiGii toxin family protein, partial [Patescibacteria group bacterium]|mgnify:CR=1